MRKRLYLRIIIAYFLFGLFGFIAVATVISRLTNDYCVRDRARILYREAVRISDTYATELYNSAVSLETVQSQMEALSAYMDTEIWILNPSGRMIVNSRRAPDPSEETIVENFDSTITAGNYYTTGSFFDSFDEEVLSVIAPITSRFKIRGYVVIHLPMAEIRRTADSMLNISYMLLVTLLVLSLIILFFFTEYVYKPLQHIIAAAEQYALGNMHYRISVEREDELGYLSASLGYMADTIARAEDDQKKFIANVSHDFRSPLTSMRGFLEAMLDGTIPPERHEHYLRVVLGETDRLTKLTNGLLTLNNLNTGGLILQRTDFDINAVIRSVAASFEQTCRSRRLQIRLILTGRILYVNADLEKIQQVLYNLVDNAVKFSRPDTEITIETTEKGETVFISVRDSGIGIPKDDQKLIWDRFYKTDLSRGKDKKGTGLGLSIVREIIRAHDENINLVSTEGVGSTFTFTLRRSDKNDELDDRGEFENADF
ncbi:MAG: HAMP domain-containing sensor histidine kinase [Eubacteriales bacterium]|nr:HAMP domain-containing sensor histidine kinase [Eubacteriales bacterium]